MDKLWDATRNTVKDGLIVELRTFAKCRFAWKALSQEIERPSGCEVGADDTENEDQNGALMVQHPS